MAALAEFRWILLGLGLVLIAGIWWWGSRGSRQAPGRSELREPTVGTSDAPAPRDSPPMFETFAAESGSREWGVPPFEPLSIRTAEFEQVPVMDLPVMTNAGMLDATHRSAVPNADAPADSMIIADFEPVPEHRAASDAPAAPAAAADMQRIVTIRVVAVDDTGWSGVSLRAVLEELGLSHGRYQVFHRKHSDGRTLFCAASLVEPGTFDLDRMPGDHYRGLTLFAVLPGPVAPNQMLDILFATANALAEQLLGEVQDDKGRPLAPEWVADLREDVARFQAQLT